MAENFYHYPDSTIFHGIPTNKRGYTFRQARALNKDNTKIERLQKRLENFYLNGLIDLDHPFTMSILTCVGIEVLGQVILGFDAKGESDALKTIQIYEMLDSKLSQTISSNFKLNYNLNRNVIGMNNNYIDSNWTSYAYILRKGLRNAFTHNYRSLGVFLDYAPKKLITINEKKGHIIINPRLFREKLIELYKDSFNDAITGTNLTYRSNALKYYDLLIR